MHSSRNRGGGEGRSARGVLPRRIVCPGGGVSAQGVSADGKYLPASIIFAFAARDKVSLSAYSASMNLSRALTGKFMLHVTQ